MAMYVVAYLYRVKNFHFPGEITCLQPSLQPGLER